MIYIFQRYRLKVNQSYSFTDEKVLVFALSVFANHLSLSYSCAKHKEICCKNNQVSF